MSVRMKHFFESNDTRDVLEWRNVWLARGAEYYHTPMTESDIETLLSLMRRYPMKPGCEYGYSGYVVYEDRPIGGILLVRIGDVTRGRFWSDPNLRGVGRKILHELHILTAWLGDIIVTARSSAAIHLMRTYPCSIYEGVDTHESTPNMPSLRFRVVYSRTPELPFMQESANVKSQKDAGLPSRAL
jgi:hypothetical protein